MQPGTHDILAAAVDQGDLGHWTAAARQEHHLRPQRHPAHRLPAHRVQLALLFSRQGEMQHRLHLLLTPPAKIMPILWPRA